MLFRLNSPGNPLFAAEYRLMRWPRKPHELDQYRNYVLVASLVIITVLAIPAHFFFGLRSFQLLLSLLLIVNVASTLVADLYCILMTIDNIGYLVSSGAWDLLRITAMTEDNIIDAKTAIATIRARRATTIAIVMRILPIAAIPLAGLIEALLAWDIRYIPASLTGSVGAILVFCPALLYLWVLEPGWQMDTLVACGVSIALKVNNHAVAVMLGFATALSLRTVQFLLFGGLTYAFTQIITPIMATRSGPGALAIPPLFVAGGLIIYLFHTLLIKLSWRVAHIAATRPTR